MVQGWLPMLLSGLFLVYYTFKLWAVLHVTHKSTTLNAVFLVLYLLYMSLLIVLPLYVVQRVSIACRLIILMEQVRILMKSHAFVRHNVPIVLFNSANTDKSETEAVFAY
jgi:sterol O-acyltransferase